MDVLGAKTSRTRPSKTKIRRGPGGEASDMCRMADPTFEPYGGVAPRWAGSRGGACAKNLENFQPENTNLSL